MASDPATRRGTADVIRFQLYVAGESSRTRRAIDNLRRLTEEDLKGRCEVEVIDVVTDPDRAEEDRILATPTLIKRSPGPRRRITGDLSDPVKVLQIIGIDPAEPAPSPTGNGP